MSRFYCRIPIGRIALLGIAETNHDKILTPGYEDLKEPVKTGVAGLRRVFLPNKYGEMSPEFTTMTHMSCTSIFFGIIFGSVSYGRVSWLDFMENNQATQFVSHFEAERKLRDVVAISMGKGALKWGWKIGAFTSFFLISSTAIAAYRGGSGFFEYVGAGAMTGAFLKMSLGLRAMISGCVIGTVLGAIGGAMSVAVLYLTGFTMEDLQKTQYELRKVRDEYVRVAEADLYGGGNAELVKAALKEEKLLNEVKLLDPKTSSSTPVEKKQ